MTNDQRTRLTSALDECRSALEAWSVSYDKLGAIRPRDPDFARMLSQHTLACERLQRAWVSLQDVTLESIIGTGRGTSDDDPML
jgi:hypothetical protein